LALGLSAGTWFQWMLLSFFLLKQSELRKNWWPLRSSLLYMLASAGMGGFAWYSRGYGSWENGPFLVYNWVNFGGILFGSALLYGLLLLVFREEQVLRLKNHILQINT
jgi:hypothetical protein